ncbi:MAG: hypothetical protein ABGX16_00975 [Pirellulales bacterium]
MTKTDSHHSQTAYEEIVAYLDGELPEVEIAQVEQKLSTNETYRRHMQGFDRVWSTLDELPGMTAGDSFSKTTIEIVANAAEQEVQQRTEALPRLRRNHTLANSIWVIAAALLGYLGYRTLRHDPNEMLIADLPVIEHVDIYSQFQSIDFLRQLRTALGDDDWIVNRQPDSLEPTEPMHQPSLFDQNLSTDGRHLWIYQLTHDHRLTLRSKYNRFHAFTPDHQESLRQLHHQLIVAKDTTQLQKVMFQYQQWLDDQPSSRRFELREMPEKSRVQSTARQVLENRRKIALQLTDEQIQEMQNYILHHLPKIRERIHAEMSPRERRAMSSLDGTKRTWAQLRLMMHRTDMAEMLGSTIMEKLTLKQRQQFQKLSRQDQMWNIFTWLRSDKFKNKGNGRREILGEQDLEDFFAEELDAAQRQELLTLPRDVMHKRLERLYWGMEDRPHSRSGVTTDQRLRPTDRHFQDGRRNDRPGPPPRHLPRNGFRPPEHGSHDRPAHDRGPPGLRGSRDHSTKPNITGKSTPNREVP